MKQLRLTLLLADLFFSHICFSQLVADAGNDIAFCYSNYEGATIGGNPSVLKIFGLEGKLVKEVLVSDSDLTLDLSDLGHGLYFYNWIIRGETVGSGKIVLE